MNNKFYREYLTQVHRLNGIERVIAPPDLNLIVIDHNKPVNELPVIDKLTQWDLVLEIEKPPIHST